MDTPTPEPTLSPEVELHRLRFEYDNLNRKWLHEKDAFFTADDACDAISIAVEKIGGIIQSLNKALADQRWHDANTEQLEEIRRIARCVHNSLIRLHATTRHEVYNALISATDSTEIARENRLIAINAAEDAASQPRTTSTRPQP